MLELKHINKYYNAGTVNEMCLFEDFCLTVRDHQFVSVVGSNGSGKTSMLNIICGSIPLVTTADRHWQEDITGCRNTSASAASDASIRIRPWAPAHP